MKIRLGSADVSSSTAVAGADLNGPLRMRSSYDFTNQIQLDITVLHVDELESGQVPVHTGLGVSLGWVIQPLLKLSVVGQSLWDSRHPKIGGPAERSEYERAVYAGLAWGL